jgi:DNA-binding beta-propeller fold protein YncE
MAQGSHPYSVAIHPSGNLLFVANTQSHRLAIVDLSTDAIDHEVDLGSNGARAVAFSADGATAYVSVENVSEVAVINVANRTIDARLPTGAGPRGIAIDPKDQSIYIAAFERATTGIKSVPNSLTVIDVAGHLKAVQALAVPAGPIADGIQFVPVGKGACSVSVRES